MLSKGGQAEEAISTMDSAKRSKKVKKKKAKKGTRLLDCSIFKTQAVVIYATAKFIMVILGIFVPTIFLVNYAKDIGVPDTEAAFLLSIIGFIDILWDACWAEMDAPPCRLPVQLCFILQWPDRYLQCQGKHLHGPCHLLPLLWHLLWNGGGTAV